MAATNPTHQTSLTCVNNKHVYIQHTLIDGRASTGGKDRSAIARKVKQITWWRAPSVHCEFLVRR